MKKHLFISLIALTTAFTACQQPGKQATATAEVKDSSAVPQTDTTKVYKAYLTVKDDLVNTDGKAAQKSAAVLSETLSSIKGCTEATGLTKRMAATDDIKSQRILFLQVSQDVIPLMKGMKSKTEPIFVAYCPMADEGKGGYWLSAQKEIKNPYYGNEMLECGEVKEEIK
jgi:Cu(I)/Ag(I) efflux system membrane fusion protein